MLSKFFSFYYYRYVPCVSSVAQLCLTLWEPMDCSLPGSSVHGISQAKILEWVAIACSRVSSWPKDRTHVSSVSCTVKWFFTTSTPWEASIDVYYVFLIKKITKYDKEYDPTYIFFPEFHINEIIANVAFTVVCFHLA